MIDCFSRPESVGSLGSSHKKGVGGRGGGGYALRKYCNRKQGISEISVLHRQVGAV